MKLVIFIVYKDALSEIGFLKNCTNDSENHSDY